MRTKHPVLSIVFILSLFSSVIISLFALATPTPAAAGANEILAYDEVPPTPTFTPILPSNTPPPTATFTPILPTNTPSPTATFTPILPTNTPSPTATFTPVPPTPTFTPTPTPFTPGNIFISSAQGGSVPGVIFSDEDILRFTITSESWAIYFDGSDVGVGNGDIDAFALLDDDSIIMSFQKTMSLSGVGTIDDSDIVRFVPTSLGSNTAGTFEWYFDGSDVGLSNGGEDINAVSVLPDGRLVISTLDNFSVSGVSGNDEDLLVFSPTSLGANTSGSWALYFDGSDVSLDTFDEDIWGTWINSVSGDLYLTTEGDFSVPGLNGNGDEIFICELNSLGSSTSCTFRSFFNGRSDGFKFKKIDGFHITD